METTRVLDAALRKAAAVWVAVDDRPARLVWTVWRDRALWLLTGAGDQIVPGLADGARCTVTLRSPATHSHLLDVPTVAHLVPLDAPERTLAMAALTAARLNSSAESRRRWAAAAVYRLDIG